MFQFPPFALTLSVTGLQPAGLPHSEITGSIPVCSSPVLIAAYHVLHRLQKPRHPPSALVTFSLYELFHESQELQYNTCSHLLVALKLQSTTFRFDSLYHFSLLYRLINFFLLTLPRYLFSNLSMNFRASQCAHCIFQKDLFTVQGSSPCNSPRSLVSKRAPKRRCSSHTFRYGYLVTT